MKCRNTGYSCKDEAPELFKFDGTVRRVSTFHVCDDECVVNAQGRSVSHSCDVLSGGLYNIMSKKNGYPPHM